MTERIGIGLVLLLIAMAQLATDVARLALEASSRPSINEPAPAPAQPGVQEMPRPPPNQPPANRKFNRLPLDFSINQPPWCPACRHRDPPRPERRYRDEW